MDEAQSESLMDLVHVRALLRSNVRIVVVEAPAGCGKTHEAVELARDVVPQLKPHQKVLILAHTNSAIGSCQQFRDTRVSHLLRNLHRIRRGPVDPDRLG